MLLATIDAMKQYDVANDAELMAALKSRAAKMHDAGWRDTTKQKIASIGRDRSDQAGIAPECG